MADSKKDSKDEEEKFNMYLEMNYHRIANVLQHLDEDCFNRIFGEFQIGKWGGQGDSLCDLRYEDRETIIQGIFASDDPEVKKILLGTVYQNLCDIIFQIEKSGCLERYLEDPVKNECIFECSGYPIEITFLYLFGKTDESGDPLLEHFYRKFCAKYDLPFETDARDNIAERERKTLELSDLIDKKTYEKNEAGLLDELQNKYNVLESTAQKRKNRIKTLEKELREEKKKTVYLNEKIKVFEKQEKERKDREKEKKEIEKKEIELKNQEQAKKTKEKFKILVIAKKAEEQKDAGTDKSHFIYRTPAEFLSGIHKDHTVYEKRFALKEGMQVADFRRLRAASPDMEFCSSIMEIKRKLSVWEEI